MLDERDHKPDLNYARVGNVSTEAGNLLGPESLKHGAKRDELLERNVGKDLIHSSIEESRRKIAQAKTELTNLFRSLEQK